MNTLYAAYAALIYAKLNFFCTANAGKSTKVEQIFTALVRMHIKTILQLAHFSTTRFCFCQ
jgi:hypothetical protein